MSFELAGACPALLIGLEQATGGRPSGLATQVGFTQSLMDPTNTAGVQIIREAGGQDGNPKKVRVVYAQRATPNQVTDTKDCDKGVSSPRLEEDYSINMASHYKYGMTEAEVRRLCTAFEQYRTLPVNTRNVNGQPRADIAVMGEIAEKFYRDIDVMRVSINQNLLAAYALQVGDWIGGGDSKTFTFIKSEDHALRLKGFNEMRQQIELTGFAGRPILFGHGNLDFAMMSAEYGCCNDAGQDFGRMRQGAPFQFYKDIHTAAALGDENSFGILIPGMAQFMSYNEYVGEFARPIGTKYRGTIPDPSIPGLVYDFSIMPDECDEMYTVQVSAYYDLFVAPRDMFKIGDRLAGVNGTFNAIANAA